jgi:hypothetical protein
MTTAKRQMAQKTGLVNGICNLPSVSALKLPRLNVTESLKGDQGKYERLHQKLQDQLLTS